MSRVLWAGLLTAMAGTLLPVPSASADGPTPALTITKSADVASATPGTTVHYTITVADTGQTSYSGAVVTDDLTDALGAAVYDGDATATAGAVGYASPVLTWTGDLAPGDTATISYSVTIDNPETGGTSMTNTVSSAEAGSTCPAEAGGSCTVTTSIVSGTLTMTAPASADLGAGPPGSVIESNLGPVQVTDDRGFGADWEASVSCGDFSTGSPGGTIPVSAATYAITGLDTSGSATFGHQPETGLSASPQTVVSATGVNGNTTATWNPVIQVSIPDGAIAGTYSATVVHSVS